jgi:rod shape-determining protein MreC
MKTLNIIALSVFTALTVAVLFLKTPTTQAIHSSVMSFFSPFIHASAAVENTTSRAITPDEDPKVLMRERDRLLLENQKLKILSQRHEDLLDENNRLRAMVGYKERAHFKNLIAAHVVKRSAASWWGSLVIDKGSEDGVEPDRAVLTDVGLVGKTGRVSKHLSEIILLTDELCRVASLIEGTREKGIVMGERGALETMPDLRMKFLSRNAPVTPGMAVYSSGDGLVFPGKLLLGRVKLFENHDISGEALVEPAVDFNQLDDVFIVGTEIASAAP